MPKMANKSKDSNKIHADHSEDLVRLRRIKGQIEGIEKMVKEGRYCIDVINQMRSVTAAIRSVESLMLNRHIGHCVKNALNAKDERIVDEKIKELLVLIAKR